MTQEHKELLLKDLCARLPYGVMLSITHNEYTDETFNARISTIDYCNEVKVRYGFEEYEQAFSLEQIKPYLYPLSSMTEEQLYEVSQILGKDVAIFTDYLLTIDHRRRTFSYQELDALVNWFDKNHFDHRGLIPMDLAIDATNLNIY